jgi:hypothetical protein
MNALTVRAAAPTLAFTVLRCRSSMFDSIDTTLASRYPSAASGLAFE